MGGLRELVGEPDREPVRVGVSIGDSIAGLYGAFSAMMGLYRREHGRAVGEADGTRPLEQRVLDVALNESVLSVMESLVPDHFAYGIRRMRVGGRMEGIAPSNAYPCASGGSVVVAANSDGLFQRLMRLIDREDLADDEQLTVNAGRWERRDELDAAIGTWTASLPRTTVLDMLQDAGIPAGPIYTAEDICVDEQYRARNMIQHFDVDTGDGQPRSVGFPGVVPVIGGTSVPVRSVGPDLGADTEAVLGGILGMDAAAIAELTGPS
jgi:formyl-CoA transferase